MSNGFRKSSLFAFFACVCIFLNTDSLGCEECTWESMTPYVDREANDFDLLGPIWWWEESGTDGLWAMARVLPVDKDNEEFTYESADSDCSRREGYECDRTGGLTIPAETFTLTWGGKCVERYGTAIANTAADASYADESGLAKCTSPDFSKPTGLWAAKSTKRAECPANPADNNHGKKESESETITVEAGLPASLTGSLNLEFATTDITKKRTATGSEASKTETASAEECSYEHPGGGTNDEVTATAWHFADVYFEYTADEDGEIDGHAKVKAETVSFSVTK